MTDTLQIDGCTILTFTGRYVDPLNLAPDDVSIDDIEHALSNQCRFSGHTRRFYSVGEHSVRVSQVLRDQLGADTQTQLQGLLHDAAEAYLVDLPRPLKHHETFGAIYRAAEERAADAIRAHFDLPLEEPTEVKDADMILLATERRDLMPAHGDWTVLDGIKPLRFTLDPWAPTTSRAMFRQRFAQLTTEAA